MNKIDNAIILNGPGRSGTTLISQILSYHDDLGWVSSWNNAFPNQSFLAILNRPYSAKLFGIDWHKIKKSPKPSEAYDYWKHFFGHFNNSNQNPQERTKDIFTNAPLVASKINGILKWQGKPRFITKITGPARKEYLDAIFEDYKLVWIERDPRVVVSSYIKQKWFYKDKPEEFANLTEEEKISFYCSYYLKLRKESKKYDDSILVRYEDLTRDTVGFFKKLCADLNLPYTSRFAQIVENWQMKEVGWDFYKEKYSAKGVEQMNNLLSEEIKELGYS